MSAINDGHRVASAGAPSTNVHVEVDVDRASAHIPLVGQMLYLTHPVTTANGDATELALGVITEVTTHNRNFENPDLAAAASGVPELAATFAGDAADTRKARLRLQAAYRRDPNPDGDTPNQWRQAGNSLSTSPPTGVPLREMSNEVIDELVTGDSLHYLGHLHGPATRGNLIRLPMDIPDYTGSRAAYHTGIFGQTGAGKTIIASYFFAAQMRHTNHGMVIIDPQGQWSHEHGMTFSLQGWAKEMGRDVIVRRITEDLRLEKDAPLFTSLLGKTRFTSELVKMSSETADLLLDEVEKILKRHPGSWETETSDVLLTHLLTGLTDQAVLNRIYADANRQDRLRDALQEILDDPSRAEDVLRYFRPLHNLFGPTNPNGAPRHSLWGTLARVFEADQRGTGPAPLLILDMSTSDVSWLDHLTADEDRAAALEALEILDRDAIKAAILRQTCATLKRASESVFRSGDNLNTMVVFDEAWRYAPPPSAATDDEIRALSVELAGYARDTRKFGIGWTYITQSPRSLNPDIWDQLLIRFIGYGMAGPDLDRIAEQLDDRDHLRLYRSFAPPDATNIYPWMLLGPVSPLSFTKAPAWLSAYTDFDVFRADNHAWISQQRLAQGKDVLSGKPTLPGAVTATVTRTSAAKKAKKATAEDMDRVREHAATGGVNPAHGAHLSTDPSFSTSLSGIDDNEDQLASPTPLGPNGRPLDPATGEEFPF